MAKFQKRKGVSVTQDEKMDALRKARSEVVIEEGGESLLWIDGACPFRHIDLGEVAPETRSDVIRLLGASWPDLSQRESFFIEEVHFLSPEWPSCRAYAVLDERLAEIEALLG